MFNAGVAVINAIMGLQGSSIDPMRDSARLQGLYIALAAFTVSFCAKYLPNVMVDQGQAVSVVTAAGYVAGSIWYVFGVVRATHKTVSGYLHRDIA